MDIRQFIARHPMHTIRPRDLAGFYREPRPEVRRLRERGVLHQLATGYYCLVPLGADPSTWRPSPETAAAAIATAIHGSDDAVLMGLSAARLHSALPRAIASAWVAIPAQHRRMEVTDGATVHFVCRDTGALEAESMSTELGQALVTTPAQTALDLARNPQITQDAETLAVIRLLLSMEPMARVERVAARQGRTGAALARLREIA